MRLESRKNRLLPVNPRPIRNLELRIAKAVLQVLRRRGRLAGQVVAEELEQLLVRFVPSWDCKRELILDLNADDQNRLGLLKPRRLRVICGLKPHFVSFCADLVTQIVVGRDVHHWADAFV